MDANALQRPKRFFWSSSKYRGGGSLTIIATALIDTGSRMDEVIFEEFKGTGNSETILDEKFPKKEYFLQLISLSQEQEEEELLFDKNDLQKMNVLKELLSYGFYGRYRIH